VVRKRIGYSLALIGSFITGLARADVPPSPSTAPPQSDPNEADRVAATAHFDKGLVLFDAGAFDTALVEFLEARRLYPLRNAVNNAVVCLEKLRRYDEALAKQEELLRDFGARMSSDFRDKAQRKLLDLRALVGTIEIENAEVGSRIVVDGQQRGEYPLLEPLRVSAGSHLVRIVKSGFEPFEARVDVTGGRSVRLPARLSPLIRSGRVRVTEQQGRVVEVLIDGAGVGPTPWEGQLPVGEHVIVLRGEGNLGTPPISVNVGLDTLTPLSLQAEELAARLRIEPSPMSASIAIDSISVGRGVWEGPLRTGNHRVEVAAPGFLPASRIVNLERDARLVLTMALERDPRSAFAIRRGHFWVGAVNSLLLAPGFGGNIGENLASGGQIQVKAGYESAAGVSVGFSVGGLRLQQTVLSRSTEVRPVDLGVDPPLLPVPMRIDHTIETQALRLGAILGLSLVNYLPLQFSVEAGALLGSTTDTRSAPPQMQPGNGEGLLARTTGESRAVRGFYVAPDIRLGWMLTSHLRATANVGMLLVVNGAPPIWDESKTHTVVIRDANARLAYGLFPNESYGNTISFVFSPGIGVEYQF
jgi:hypothetical protein